MRADHARSRSVEVVSGVRIVQCHASIDVVIGVRVMLCHQATDNSGFSTFLNFPLRVQILTLLSCCFNSSLLLPVAILCTHLHLENTSCEVWYLNALHCVKESVSNNSNSSTLSTSFSLTSH